MSPGDKLPDPAELFRRMEEESEADSQEKAAPSLPDPAELFRQMAEEESDESGLFPQEEEPADSGLFPEPEEEHSSLGIFSDDEPEAGESFPDSDELFARMKAHRERSGRPKETSSIDDGSETLLDFRGRTLGVDLTSDGPEVEPTPSLPNPAELFQQMEEERAEEDAGAAPELRLMRQEPEESSSLPDPAALFRQMEEEQTEEPEPTQTLPNPAQLFEQMKSSGALRIDDAPEAEPEPEPELEARPQLRFEPAPELESESPQLELRREPAPEPAPEPQSLPALPDLDALKAEMDAEARANLDEDLLGDLSGPERFANTVSDSMFMRPAFAEVPEEEPEAAPLLRPQTPPLPEPEPAPAPVAPPEPAPPPARPEPPVQAAPKAEAAKPAPPPKRNEPGKPAPKVSEKASTVRVGQVPSAVPKKPQKPKKAATPLPPQSSPSRSGGGGLKFHSPKPQKRERGASTAVISGGAAQRRVQPKQEKGATLSAGGALKIFQRTHKIGRHDLCIFTRQLSAMLKAGIPLHLGVSFCAESDPDLAPILYDVVMKIEAGFSFSAALKEYPDSFDPVYVGLVNAGELSGRLNEMLARLADVLEREIELRKRLISVITYPSVLLGVSILGTLGFILFVLPQLTPLFMDLEVDLPLPTQILLGFRKVMVPLLIVTILAVVAAFLAQDTVKAYIRSRPILERRLAAIPFDIPVLGDVYEKIIVARILYALSTMLDVGVTMAQALARAEITCGNAFIAHRLARSREDLCDGNSVTDCFRINDVFPPTALHLIAAGEESAQLTTMFSYVAKHFDEDVENSLDAAASMLEPLIMVFMGCIVGFIVIAAALPTIKLLQAF